MHQQRLLKSIEKRASKGAPPPPPAERPSDKKPPRKDEDNVLHQYHDWMVDRKMMRPEDSLSPGKKRR